MQKTAVALSMVHVLLTRSTQRIAAVSKLIHAMSSPHAPEKEQWTWWGLNRAAKEEEKE